MEPIDAASIDVVLDAYGPERAALLAFLEGLSDSDWDQPTECPAYSVKGIATHVLGDDLSLLSRQRDGAVQGLVLVAEKMPGVDFRTLLDAFNDQWVEAARFVSPAMLIALLRFSGEQTLGYYREVDPTSPGEPVPMFNPQMGTPSPFWHAIAREFLERWVHHSQIRRALGQRSFMDPTLLEVGVRIVASAAGVPPIAPSAGGGDWAIGPLVLGDSHQTADILTLAFTEEQVRELVVGPPDAVAQFATRLGRRVIPE